MDKLVEHLYESANGDRWLLMRDAPSARLFVRHEPNRSSGGQVRDIDIDAFLKIDGPGPEYAALKTWLADRGESAERRDP